jgi:hypothetical protein
MNGYWIAIEIVQCILIVGLFIHAHGVNLCLEEYLELFRDMSADSHSAMTEGQG